MGTYTKEQKLEHLRLFKASGKSCYAYSMENGVPTSSMYEWTHRYGDQPSETQPGMVKLPYRPLQPKSVAPEALSKATPTITLSIGPWSAAITSGVSRSDLEVLVSILGGAHHAN
ncbi:MAG: hypothetical protein WCS35_09800 [Sphaerochaeta sp.]|nr:hypothetical protein [Sphaerochaeta sp.]